MNQLIRLSLTFLTLAVALLSLSSGYMVEGSVYVGTSSSQNTFLADGQTVYRIDVLADNRGLPGDTSSGIEWTLSFPSYIEVTSYSVPTQNDFFEGFSPFWQQVNVNSPSGRQMWESGPQSREGIVASYWFKVRTTAPSGLFVPGLDGVQVGNGAGVPQSVHVDQASFNIIRPVSCPKVYTQTPGMQRFNRCDFHQQMIALEDPASA